MQVKEIMTCDVETIDSDITIIQAANLMKQLDIGALPVWKEQRLIGMVTDRDITVRAVAEGKDPSETCVKDIMTPQVYYCFEDDDIHEAASLMEEKSIHRLLVLSEDNQPVGFLTLADFAVKCRDERLAWEILEKLSEPASPHR
jgi:CBS domain-containing protein